jgi:hypothetical protein
MTSKVGHQDKQAKELPAKPVNVPPTNVVLGGARKDYGKK